VLIGGKIAIAVDPVTREDDVALLDWGDPEASGPTIRFAVIHPEGLSPEENPVDEEQDEVETFTYLSAN
jgi:hypothetical protein